MNIKLITEHLRKMSLEAYTMADDGDVVTRAEALADLLWKSALGWTEETRDDKGNKQIKKHAPATWAINVVLEKLEGKTPIAIADTGATGRKAADKVSDLARERVNAAAEGKD